MKQAIVYFLKREGIAYLRKRDAVIVYTPNRKAEVTFRTDES